MKALPWLSDSLGRLKPREQRVVVGGAILCVAALVIVELVLPIAHQWELRDTAYAAARDQWVRLATLNASMGRLQRVRDEHNDSFDADAERLVDGATPALAASNLQGLLQGYATESAVQIERVDVASEAHPDRAGLLTIPVQLQARGDVAALVDFLYRLEHGDKLLVIDELTVNASSEALLSGASAVASSGAQAQTLSWTLSLHGLYGTDGRSSRVGTDSSGGAVSKVPAVPPRIPTIPKTS
jgi:type II secretory pathway component PulM